MAFLLAFVGTQAAVAATVQEITARWATSPTPATVAEGEVIVSEWRFNINDDALAPNKDAVPNVYATITATNGVFKTLPAACLTGVDPLADPAADFVPQSGISADGTILTCNFGTVDEGTAIALQVPVVAGVAGQDVSLSGTFGGDPKPTPAIPVVKGIDIDFKLSEPNKWFSGTASPLTLEFPWSLYLGNNSHVGEETLTYTITTKMESNAVLLTTGLDCGEFTRTGIVGMSGHPWSGVADSVQTANSVPTCTLVAGANPGEFTLTLSGLTWDVTDAPTKDSAGNLLPVDAKVVASGVLIFQIAPEKSTSTLAGLTITANAPSYTSPDAPGIVGVDDVSNNTATKLAPLQLGWSGIWGRGGTGTSSWDDKLRTSAGATMTTYMDATIPRVSGRMSQCTLLDTKYVEFVGPVVPGAVPKDAVDFMGPTTVSYYTGTEPKLDPNSGSYNPDAITGGCDFDSAGWTTTLPADLSTVKAVRVDFEKDDMARLERVALGVPVQIKEDVAVGQDIWVWHWVNATGTWINGSNVPKTTVAQPARYGRTHQGRDLLRIVAATPAITKAVDTPIIAPGEKATFTLNYSANGGTNIPATVADPYKIVDTLPLGLSYVPGSANPATPAPVITTNANGQQVLTWTLTDVRTNWDNILTYQATTNTATQSGVVMKNSAQAIITTPNSTTPDLFSKYAEASVTVSDKGITEITKKANEALIVPALDRPAADGVGTAEWVVTLQDNDLAGQNFTDIIDILPYNGDNRITDFSLDDPDTPEIEWNTTVHAKTGSEFSGDYKVTGVTTADSIGGNGGAVVYYTTALPYEDLNGNPPVLTSDDPADPSNGEAGDITGATNNTPNTVGWTTIMPDPWKITAIRVIAGPLAAGTTRTFTVGVETIGAKATDVYVNRAQGRAEHTELVMRHSAAMTFETPYAFELKKYVFVPDAVPNLEVNPEGGVWHDAQDGEPTDWPEFTTTTASAVKYKIVVTNTGLGDLEQINVTDDLFPNGSHTIETLPAGASNTHEFTADLSGKTSPVRNLAEATTLIPDGPLQGKELGEQPHMAGLTSDEANVTITTPAPTLLDFHVEKQGLNCDTTKPTCQLPGAEFALYGTDPSTAGATPIATGITAAAPVATDPPIPAAFTGLTAGNYWLVETKAPTGHVLLPNPIAFTLGTGGITLLGDQSALVALKVSDPVQATDAFTLVVSDATPAPLPKAGGDGPFGYVMVALLLLGAAAGVQRMNPPRRLAPRRVLH